MIAARRARSRCTARADRLEPRRSSAPHRSTAALSVLGDSSRTSDSIVSRSQSLTCSRHQVEDNSGLEQFASRAVVIIVGMRASLRSVRGSPPAAAWLSAQAQAPPQPFPAAGAITETWHAEGRAASQAWRHAVAAARAGRGADRGHARRADLSAARVHRVVRRRPRPAVLPLRHERAVCADRRRSTRRAEAARRADLR